MMESPISLMKWTFFEHYWTFNHTVILRLFPCGANANFANIINYTNTKTRQTGSIQYIRYNSR